ncbi:hypothetical protein J2X12_001956, partial [Pseudarthrobacter oxydans]
EWDVRVSSKEDPGGHADVYWPGSLHHSTGHYSTAPMIQYTGWPVLLADFDQMWDLMYSNHKFFEPTQ